MSRFVISKEGLEVVFIPKNAFSVHENLSTPSFGRLLGSRADVTQIRKLGIKFLKSAKGVCKVVMPVFSELKNRSTMKKPFEHWLEVSGVQNELFSI